MQNSRKRGKKIYLQRWEFGPMWTILRILRPRAENTHMEWLTGSAALGRASSLPRSSEAAVSCCPMSVYASFRLSESTGLIRLACVSTETAVPALLKFRGCSQRGSTLICGWEAGKEKMVTTSDNALWQPREASWGFWVPNDREGNCDWKEPTDMTLIKNRSIPHERKSSNNS